jgi:hypothetical protein
MQCVPEQSSGTRSQEKEASIAVCSEAEFRGRSFPNRVRERIHLLSQASSSLEYALDNHTPPKFVRVDGLDAATTTRIESEDSAMFRVLLLGVAIASQLMSSARADAPTGATASRKGQYKIETVTEQPVHDSKVAHGFDASKAPTHAGPDADHIQPHLNATLQPASRASCAPGYIERRITCFRTEWRERDVAVTVPKVVFHTEVVPVKRTVLTPVCHDEKRVVTTFVQVPKHIEREVESTTVVKTTVTDSCGKSATAVSPPKTIAAKQCTTVFETVPVQKEVCVQVRTLEPRVEVSQVTRTVAETKCETLVRKERYAVSVPYEKIVLVPVCQVRCVHFEPVCHRHCCWF